MTIKFTVPENFSEVTVRQHRQIMRAWEMDSNPGRVEAIIAAICKIKLDIASALGVSVVEEILGTVAWMRATPSPGLFPLKKFFTLDGVDYGFINNMTNLTLGEYVDLESRAETGFYDGMAGVLAILYRPVVTKTMNQYTIEPYNDDPDRREAMEECPMDVALGAMLFFWSTAKTLSLATLQSLAREDQAQLEKSGDGTESSTTSPEET